MSSPPASTNARLPWPLIVACGLVVLAAGLRLWPVTESLWLDELHTAWCAVGGLTEVASRAAIGNQSPLFFWLHWLLIRVLGPSELALRLPSIVAGSLLPLAIYLLARRWSTSGVGLVAAAIVTIDPAAIFYATEARPYALVQLLAVIHIAVTAELIVRPATRLRVVWVLVAALLFHLHYTAALLIPAELVCYVLIAALRPPLIGYRWTSLLIDAVIAAVLWLPAAGNLLAIFGRRANWAEFVKLQPLSIIFDWWPWALGIWYVVAAVAIDRALAAKQPSDALGSTRRFGFPPLVVSWFIIPTLIAWLFTTNDIARLFFPRYLIAAAPAAILLAALCVELAPWIWGKLLVGTLVLALGVWSSGIVKRLRSDGRVIEPRGEDWRGCVDWLNGQLPQTQYPVLVASGLIEADGLRQPHDELLDDYCLLPVTSLYPLDADRSDLFPLPMHEPGRLEQVVEMLVVHRGGAWLIVRSDQPAGRRVADRIIAGLERSNSAGATATWRTVESRSFGQVQVHLLTGAAMPPVQP